VVVTVRLGRNDREFVHLFGRVCQRRSIGRLVRRLRSPPRARRHAARQPCSTTAAAQARLDGPVWHCRRIGFVQDVEERFEDIDRHRAYLDIAYLDAPGFGSRVEIKATMGNTGIMTSPGSRARAPAGVGGAVLCFGGRNVAGQP